MNETDKKFFSPGDRFMLGMHLKQPELTYSACGLLFTKNKSRIQKFEEAGDSKYIYTKRYIYESFFFNMVWLMEILKI